MEYLALAKALAVEWPFALGTIFLTSIYHAFSHYVVEDPYHRVGGALWFVRHWLFVYFPEFSSHHTLTPKIEPPICTTMPQNELMTFFMGLADHPLRLLYLRPVHVDPAV